MIGAELPIELTLMTRAGVGAGQGKNAYQYKQGLVNHVYLPCLRWFMNRESSAARELNMDEQG